MNTEKVQIPNGMFAILIIDSMWVIAIGMSQGTLTRAVGNNNWITSIFSFIIGIIIMWLTVKILIKTPGKNIIEQSELLIGKWPAKLISISAMAYFGTTFIALMITIVEHVVLYLLPEANIGVVIFFMTFVSIVAGYYGIEVLGRLAWIGFFCLWSFHLLLIVGTIQQFKADNFLPVMNRPVLDVLSASWYINPTWGLATMSAALILPLVKDSKKWKKSSLVGFFLGSVFVLIWPILQIGIITANVSSKYCVLCMELMRYAKLGDFFQRYEIVMSTLGLIVFSVQLFLCFLCFMHSTASIFGKKGYRSFLIPVSIIIGIISYWFCADHFRSMNFMEIIWPAIANPIILGIPLITLVLGWMFKRRIKNNSNISQRH